MIKSHHRQHNNILRCSVPQLLVFMTFLNNKVGIEGTHEGRI